MIGIIKFISHLFQCNTKRDQCFVKNETEETTRFYYSTENFCHELSKRHVDTNLPISSHLINISETGSFILLIKAFKQQTGANYILVNNFLVQCMFIFVEAIGRLASIYACKT